MGLLNVTRISRRSGSTLVAPSFGSTLRTTAGRSASSSRSISVLASPACVFPVLDGTAGGCAAATVRDFEPGVTTGAVADRGWGAWGAARPTETYQAASPA